MGRAAPDLRPVDAATAEPLLSAAGLPTADLRGPVSLYGAYDGELVGVAGLEPAGSVGLLRSVAVASEHRGRGYGTALCAGVAERARKSGAEALYLLTTGAEEFFAARGYEAVGRERVPAAVRETQQFDALCPATATVMRRRL